MPRYYFDIRDDSGVHRDEVGLEFANMEAAILEARRTLGDMTRESMALGRDTDISIIVRDGDEGPVNLTVTSTTERPDD